MLLTYVTFLSSFLLFLYIHLSALLLPSCLCLLALLFGKVAVVVEVTEESDEAERVGQHNHVHGIREVTVSEQVVGGVDGDYEKLELGGETGRREMTVADDQSDKETLPPTQRCVRRHKKKASSQSQIQKIWHTIR